MSLKRNFIYNSILTISGYLFPLLTYPYVTRVLGVENIGICNFVDSIINYFILFSMMGIGAVGMREISQCRDDRRKMSKSFTSLLALNLITTLMAIIVLVIAIYAVPALYPYKELLGIGVCKLFFNFFLIEWFYAGVEDFAYITKRSIFVRSIYVVLVFLLIKRPEDYQLYYFLTVGTYFFNGFINVFYCRRYIDITLRDINIRPYVNTFLTIGLYMLITNVYTSLNVTWLGFEAGAVEVGYYTTATKLYTIIMAMFTALTNVVYPRVTYLYSKGKTEEFWNKVNAVVGIILGISVPLVCLLIVYGPSMVHVLTGDGYEGAYLPFRIIAPLILIVGYEQVLVIQILMAMKHDKEITLNAICGAVITIVLSIPVVSHMGAIGTALVWGVTELAIVFLSLRVIYRVTTYRFPTRLFLKNILFCIPLFAILYIIHAALGMQHDNVWKEMLLLLVIGAITAIYTIFVQIRCLKNEMFSQMVERIYSMLKIKKDTLR